MSSVVSICNLALSHIGKDNIDALTEGTTEARACNQFYDQARDALIEGYPWRFCEKIQSMAELPSGALGLGKYAYQKPSDCKKIISVADKSIATGLITDAVPQGAYGHEFRVSGETIYCDLSPAYLVYTHKVTDPTKFPALFVSALSWHLATLLAMPLTRDPRVRSGAYEVATQLLLEAQMMDANEQRENYNHSDDFTGAR